MTSTIVATWTTIYPYELTPSLNDVVGDFAGEFDMDAANSQYVDEINAVLPDGLVLAGDQFIADAAAAFDWDEIRETIAGINTAAILEANER